MSVLWTVCFISVIKSDKKQKKCLAKRIICLIVAKILILFDNKLTLHHYFSIERFLGVTVWILYQSYIL